MFIAFSVNAQSVYKICEEEKNQVSNSTFDQADNNSTSVPDWTFSPGGNDRGWKKAKTRIYGSYLVINRIGKYTASPNGVSLCSGSGKLIKFRFNTSGTGVFEYTVNAGSQELVTIKNNGLLAQALITAKPGIEVTLNREYLSEKTFNVATTEPTVVVNNIWHEVEVFVPNYIGGEGSVNFTYDRSSGILRQVMLDNVEVYDALPKPELSLTEVTLAEGQTTYNLNNIVISNKGNYNVEWHKADDGTIVSNPSAVDKGQYYAVFSSNCSSSCTGSKAFVTVSGAGCGNNIIKNGDFENQTNVWTLSENSSFTSVTVGEEFGI